MGSCGACEQPDKLGEISFQVAPQYMNLKELLLFLQFVAHAGLKMSILPLSLLFPRINNMYHYVQLLLACLNFIRDAYTYVRVLKILFNRNKLSVTFGSLESAM